MSHYYLDASAIVKRYSPEIGTAWVKALTDPGAGHTIVLGEITLAEVAAAITAKHRAPGGITVEERSNAIALFLSHCMIDYELIAINRFIIDRAVNLTLNHKLRGYDAVQLATALVANAALPSLVAAVPGLQGARSPLRPPGYAVDASPLLFAVSPRLRHGRKTRYGWMAHPYPTGTFTLPETPSLPWRDNAGFKRTFFLDKCL